MPQVDERSLDRTARAGQYLTVDLDQPSLGVRLNEISALRRTRFEISMAPCQLTLDVAFFPDQGCARAVRRKQAHCAAASAPAWLQSTRPASAAASSHWPSSR